MSSTSDNTTMRRLGTGTVVATFVTIWVGLGFAYAALASNKNADAWQLDSLDVKEPCRSQAIVVDAFRKVSCDHPEHRLYLEPLASFVRQEKEDATPWVTENHWIARCVCTSQIQEEIEMATCDREEHGAVQDARSLLNELRKFEKERRIDAQEKK
jgi:hypothetical protein